MCHGRKNAAMSHFQKAQNNDSGSISKIVAGFYSSCLQMDGAKGTK
jgi:hypothetical protein